MGTGKVFFAKDFVDFAGRSMVDVTLARLALEGRIRRVGRGLYDVPAGPGAGPDLDEVARAIARRRRWKIVPGGAWAAQQLGLTGEGPVEVEYVTDGPNHEARVGERRIVFRHGRPKDALVVQALRHLGKERVGAEEIEKLRGALSATERRALVKDTRFGAGWIYEVAKRIAG